MPSSYPPIEIPTFTYVYPAPSTVADYLAMVGSVRPTPVVTDDESEIWDALGDFA